jgi:hypothetical protein
MVLAYRPLEYADLFGVANLSDDIAKAEANLIFEDLFSVLGDPDYVVHAGVRRVAGVTVLRGHVHILMLKPRTESPEYYPLRKMEPPGQAGPFQVRFAR